jgi:O-antigen/teichoic acid export membrane protein
VVPLGAYGVFASSGVAAGAAVGFSLFFLVRRFHYRPRLAVPWRVMREQASYSGANYLASLFNLLPMLIVPLIIINGRGATDAAYFYMAFQMVNMLNAVTYAVSQSMFAEGSYGEVPLGRLAARSARLLAATVLPLSALLAILSGALLHLFGGAYSHHASGTLMVLALSAPATAFTTWTSALLRLTRQLAALVLANVVYFVAICGLSALVVHRGLDWMAGAWLVGNVFAGIVGGAALAVRARRMGASAPVLSASTLTPAVARAGYSEDRPGGRPLLTVRLDDCRQLTSGPPTTISSHDPGGERR